MTICVLPGQAIEKAEQDKLLTPEAEEVTGQGHDNTAGEGSRQNVRLWPLIQDLVASRSLFLSLGLDFPTGRDILSYELTLCSFITCYCWTRQTFGPNKVVSVPARHRSIGHSQI